jgi:hypothetical protein
LGFALSRAGPTPLFRLRLGCTLALLNMMPKSGNRFSGKIMLQLDI